MSDRVAGRRGSLIGLVVETQPAGVTSAATSDTVRPLLKA